MILKAKLRNRGKISYSKESLVHFVSNVQNSSQCKSRILPQYPLIIRMDISKATSALSIAYTACKPLGRNLTSVLQQHVNLTQYYLINFQLYTCCYKFEYPLWKFHKLEYVDLCPYNVKRPRQLTHCYARIRDRNAETELNYFDKCFYTVTFNCCSSLLTVVKYMGWFCFELR